MLVGGGSGHGFKHGPAVGRYAADLLLGRLRTPEPRFSLATKAEQARAARFTDPAHARALRREIGPAGFADPRRRAIRPSTSS